MIRNVFECMSECHFASLSMPFKHAMKQNFVRLIPLTKQASAGGSKFENTVDFLPIEFAYADSAIVMQEYLRRCIMSKSMQNAY